MDDLEIIKTQRGNLYPYSTQAILSNLLEITQYSFINGISFDSQENTPLARLDRRDKKLLNEYIGIVDTFSAIQQIKNVAAGRGGVVQGVMHSHGIRVEFDESDNVNDDDVSLFKTYIVLLRNKFAHLGFGLSADGYSSVHHVQGRIAAGNYFSFEVGEIAEIHRLVTMDIDSFGNTPYKQRSDVSMLLLSTFLSDLCNMILDVLHDIVGREIKENDNIKIFNKNKIIEAIQKDSLYTLINNYVNTGKCARQDKSNGGLEILFDTLNKLRNAVVHDGIKEQNGTFIFDDENETIANLTLQDIFDLTKAIISSSIIDKNIKVLKFTVPTQKPDTMQIRKMPEVQQLIQERAGQKIQEKINELYDEQKNTIATNRRKYIAQIEAGKEWVLSTKPEKIDFLNFDDDIEND